MSEKLRIGVIGVGHLGQHHARLLNLNENCILTGIFDSDSGRAKRLAEKNSTEAFDDLDSLLDKIDAVTIATPTISHFETASKCLERSIHTLVEKPITRTIKEAEDLLESARKNDVYLQVGHVERFNGAILAIKDHVSSPRFIEVHRLSPFPERSTDVGVVLDLMIHDIDILLSLVRSKVEAIDPIGTEVVTSKEDIANARIRFSNGCVANVTASRVSYQTMRKIRIFEQDRYISVDYHKQDAVIYSKKKGVGEVTSPKDIQRTKPKIEKTEPLKLELNAFVEACRGGEGRAATGEEGRNALEIALEIGNRIAKRDFS